MAFVNAKLSHEQRMELINRNITYIYNEAGDKKVVNPINVTCDRDRNMFLTYVGIVSRDTPEKIIFYFEWEHNSFFIHIRKHKEKINNKLRVKWDEFKVLSSTDEAYNSEALIKYLKEALKAYGLLGMPEITISESEIEYIFDF